MCSEHVDLGQMGAGRESPALMNARQMRAQRVWVQVDRSCVTSKIGKYSSDHEAWVLGLGEWLPSFQCFQSPHTCVEIRTWSEAPGMAPSPLTLLFWKWLWGRSVKKCQPCSRNSTKKDRCLWRACGFLWAPTLIFHALHWVLSSNVVFFGGVFFFLIQETKWLLGTLSHSFPKTESLGMFVLCQIKEENEVNF